jgi:ATP-dependent DNA ligase
MSDAFESEIHFIMYRRAKTRLDSLPRKEAAFIEPMECLFVSKLSEGSQWLWEIKLDGYRALAGKSGNDVTLFSRRRKSLNRKFPYIVEPLIALPEGTVVDGELVGLDDSGRPDFNRVVYSWVFGRQFHRLFA